MVTAAAWNDSAHAVGNFTAGQFSLWGSTDGANYELYPADDPGQLSFGVEADELAPGTSIYAPFSVRTGEESVGGTLEMFADEEANAVGLGPFLTYGVARISGPVCDAGSFAEGAELVQDGSPLTAHGSSAHSLAAGGEAPVHLCLKITHPVDSSDAARGQGVTAVWELRATAGISE